MRSSRSSACASWKRFETSGPESVGQQRKSSSIKRSDLKRKASLVRDFLARTGIGDVSISVVCSSTAVSTVERPALAEVATCLAEAASCLAETARSLDEAASLRAFSTSPPTSFLCGPMAAQSSVGVTAVDMLCSGDVHCGCQRFRLQVGRRASGQGWGTGAEHRAPPAVQGSTSAARREM